MRVTGRILVVAIVMGLAFAGGTFLSRAQQNPLQAPKDPSPLYVVTFVDFAGGSTVAGAGTNEVKQYVLETRKDPGIIRCDALSQLNRTNHLVIIEVWQNQQAFEQHESAEHTKAFRASMQPILGAPFDQRLHFVVQ
jgi:quinol monooxygenase YgiN